MNYRNGKAAGVGHMVVLLVDSGAIAGTVGRLMADEATAEVIVLERRERGQACVREWIEAGGEFFEPVLRQVAVEDLLAAEDCREEGEDAASIEARIKTAFPEMVPSGGHDLVEELMGLLRVTRGQRDSHEKLWNETRAKLELAQREIVALKEALAEDATAEKDKQIQALVDTSANLALELGKSRTEIEALNQRLAGAAVPAPVQDKATLSLFPEQGPGGGTPPSTAGGTPAATSEAAS